MSDPLFSCCGVFQEDEKFLTEVFAQLTDEATEDDKRRELVLHSPAPRTHSAIAHGSLSRLSPLTSTGQLLQGVLCFLTNTAAAEQRRFLQNAGKPGDFTCLGNSDGECAGSCPFTVNILKSLSWSWM